MGQPQTPSGKKGIVGIIFNCEIRKLEEISSYIAELMNHIVVEQVGKCFHNSQFQMARFHSNWDVAKLYFLKYTLQIYFSF